MKKIKLFEEYDNVENNQVDEYSSGGGIKSGYAVGEITDDNELIKAVMKLAKGSKKAANKILKKLIKLTEGEENLEIKD